MQRGKRASTHFCRTAWTEEQTDNLFCFPVVTKLISIVDVNWTCWLVWSVSETEQQSDKFPTSQLPGLTGGADDAEANKSWEISCWSGAADTKVRYRNKRSSRIFFRLCWKVLQFWESLFKTINLLKDTKLKQSWKEIISIICNLISSENSFYPNN